MAAALPVSRDRDRPVPPRLLAEAGAAIVAASLAIRLASFRRIAGFFERPAKNARAAAEAEAYWIRRAVGAWGRRAPWRAKCFEQGLAAAALLRRRGLAYSIHYGASQADGRLTAHVWVTSGQTDVIGTDEAMARFVRVARFDG